jgi:hypothetical protein
MPAPPAITEEYIATHTKVAGHSGHLYVLPAFKTMQNESQSYTAMTALIAEGNFKEHASIVDVARLSWVIFVYYVTELGADITAQLQALDCDIIGVGRIAGKQMTAICRRWRITKRFAITDVAVGKVMSVNIRNRTDPHELIIKIVHAWGSICTTVHCNFDVKVIAAPTMTTVIQEWKDLTSADINMQIGQAKAKSVKKRTAREALIVNVKTELLAAMRASSEGVSTIRFNAGDDHLSLFSVVPPPSQLILRSYDPETGALVYSDLREWCDGGLFAERSLVIHGIAQCAKTPLARAICARLAGASQAGGSTPFYLKVGTADSLCTAMRDGQMREGVPILFDEVTPSVTRGSRPAMSFEDIKHMTEAADTSALDGHNSDIVFARLQPKIFTSNAKSPHDWFRDLPPDIFAMTDAQRLAQPANVAAVFKRCFFLHLTSCVIPQAVRDAHRLASRDELSSQIARFAGPPMA